MKEKRYRILLVEDDAADAEFNRLETEKVLPDCEFRLVASEGDFLASLAEFAPDLILSDYSMPGFSGMAALAHTLRESPSTPFIIVTGSVEEDTAVDCILAGATNYVVKQQLKRLGPAILHALDEKEKNEERIRSDKALIESEERFRSLFHSNLLVMMLINLEDGSLLDVNPAAEQFFGMNREELLASSLLDMIETDGSTLDDIREELLAGRRFFEFSLRTPGGESREIEVYGSRISVGDRLVLYAVVHDISERKAMLQELISAESRNSYFAMIEESGERLINIINDLVDIAKIETGQISVTPGWFMFDEELDRLFTRFETLARDKGLSLLMRRPASGAGRLLMADRSRWIQILSNLLKNAVKFTASGSITMGYSISDTQVEFFVSDTGVGIDPQYGQIIFDRFRQIDSSNRGHEGTGLGLAISKAYAEKMGGSIRFASEPGKGTTFFFALPLDKPDSATDDARGKASAETESRCPDPLVLVVDDDETSGLLLHHMLSREHIRVLLAGSGEQALSYVTSYPDICLILMDIKMPVMDGYEATKKVKEIRPGLPVMAQTAYANAFDRERILASGFDDFISKPIIKKELLSKMERFLKRQA